MTPRTSVRARAREIYGEMAGATAAPQAMPPTPNPSPQGGGEQTEQGARLEPDLTSRVRALYEKSAVPVREIAAIAGVTERTIYKYVAKGGWTKRYARAPQAIDGAADVAPAKGAGGRFIRREDKAKPYPTGLKATDPSGRSKALASCGKAQRLSRAAQAEAARDAQDERVLRAFAFVNRVGKGLAAYQQERIRKGTAARADDPLLRAHELTFQVAVDELEEEMAAKTALSQCR